MKETNWLGDEPTDRGRRGRAAQPVLARVRSTRDRRRRRGWPWPAARSSVVFDAPEEAVAPGQACVLYDAAEPSRVLGGGFIARD